MKKRSAPKWWPDAGLLMLRLSVAVIFIFAGAGKLGDLEMVSGMLGGLGFPAPGFFAYVLAITELVCGLAVLFGVWTRWAAALLSFTMIVALLTAHIGGSFQEAIPAIAMLGSTLALFGVGAGKWALYEDCPCHK